MEEHHTQFQDAMKKSPAGMITETLFHSKYVDRLTVTIEGNMAAES